MVNRDTDSTQTAAQWLERLQVRPGWQILQVDAADQPVDDYFNLTLVHFTSDRRLETTGTPPVLAAGGQLPLAAGCFDLVICDRAAGRCPDFFHPACEIRRALRPGGLLLLRDLLLPEAMQAALYVDAFTALHDRGHRRGGSLWDWQGLLLDAGFAVREHFSETLERPLAGRFSPQEQMRLEVLLRQAPPPAADWLRPRCIGGPDASYTAHYIVIIGQKQPDSGGT